MNRTALCVIFAALSLLPGLAWSAPRAKMTGSVQSTSLERADGAQAEITLAGRDASRQLLVNGVTSGGQTRDITREVSYQSQPAGIVHVDATGLVTPLAEGRAVIRVSSKAGPKTEIVVRVTHLERDLPVNFANQVVPVFTKYGCNSGGCHGKTDGQNGFKLSLLGFEPEEDFERLSLESRGRRLTFASPDESLLLRKATGVAPHGGGRRMEVDSASYQLLRRWVEQGAPQGAASDPTVTRIEVFPKERSLSLNGQQQLAVLAHFSDGSTADVTRLTQFESNERDIADVSEQGLVQVNARTGFAAMMVRFQSHVDVFRAIVPLGADVPPARESDNFIDALTHRQLERLGVPPSPPCDDATFVRRATLDLAGRLPTVAEMREFFDDPRPDKDARLIDRLLESDEYADYFANKWSAVLRNRRASDKDDSAPTVAFHEWIRGAIRENRPFDAFVRDILTATGEEIKTPPAVWYREVNDVYARVEDVSQLFLGQRIGCARCHHHPFEKWSQQDYYGLAAFFSRLDVVDPPAPKKGKNDKTNPRKPPLTVAHKKGKAEATNPNTGNDVLPTGLGGEPLSIDAAEDPRGELADWLSAKENPFFARSLANRYWKHFLGRGLVEPEDDLRATNPPTNPELLDALAAKVVASGFDLKSLIRAIATSEAYRRSSLPNEFNSDDQQNYSRFLPKRLHAEVLLDAIDTVTQSPSKLPGSVTRAVALPDNQSGSYFLGVFGRPDSASACECERSADASLAQCLHLINSKEILDKVSGTRARDLAKDKRPHEERLKELYLIALAREPDAEELAALTKHIEEKSDQSAAYADIVWAVINTKEFLFNH